MTLLEAAPYICGVAFATYFTLFNRSGLHSGVTFLVLSAITLVFSIVWYWINKENIGEVTTRGMQLTVLGSILNGFAGILLFWLISKSSQASVGGRLTVMTIVQVVMVSLIIPAILVGGGAVTRQRLVGVVLGALSIYFLR